MNLELQFAGASISAGLIDTLIVLFAETILRR